MLKRNWLGNRSIEVVSAMACGAGATASDGSECGHYGFFTSRVLEHIGRRDTIRNVFALVSADMSISTTDQRMSYIESTSKRIRIHR